MFGKSKRVQQPNFKFNIGDKVKDTITGFQGIITARTQWLNNCNTYNVQSQELKDGQPTDRVFFDEPQLELVESDVYEPKQTTGGPERVVLATNR